MQKVHEDATQTPKKRGIFAVWAGVRRCLTPFYFNLGERGFAQIVIIAIIGIIALFGFSAVAAINWKFILALFAMGIVAMAFVGVLFFKADFKMVMLAALCSFGIIFVLEVGFVTIIGGCVVLAALWQMKLLKKQPLIICTLVAIGLFVMLFGAKMVLLPLGVMP